MSAPFAIKAPAQFTSPTTGQLKWLLAQGISTAAMIWSTPLLVTRGDRVADQFVYDPDSRQQWLVFAEARSCVEWEQVDTFYWQPRTQEIVSDYRGFALGEEAGMNGPVSWAFDQGWLRIFANPFRWLQHGRQGIVVARWDLAFDKLRDVPRIKYDEEVHPLWLQWMKPQRMPEVRVIKHRRLAA